MMKYALGHVDAERRASRLGQGVVLGWLQLLLALILLSLFSEALVSPASAQGVLNIETVNLEERNPDVVSGTVTVTRTVGQQYNLPDGQGAVRIVLNDDGTTSITGTVNGVRINRTGPKPLGSLNAGSNEGVTPPPIKANFDAVPAGGPAQILLPRTLSDVLIAKYPLLKQTFGTFVVIPNGDPHEIGCEGANLQVLQGTLNCTTTIATTTTDFVTDVTFVDQIIVTQISVADLERLLRPELALDGLMENQRAVAVNLNALSQLPSFAGSPLETIFTTLAGLPFAEFAKALDQLHPEPYDAWTETAQSQARAFHAAILERMARARQAAAGIAPTAVEGDSQNTWQAWGMPQVLRSIAIGRCRTSATPQEVAASRPDGIPRSLITRLLVSQSSTIARLLMWTAAHLAISTRQWSVFMALGRGPISRTMRPRSSAITGRMSIAVFRLQTAPSADRHRHHPIGRNFPRK